METTEAQMWGAYSLEQGLGEAGGLQESSDPAAPSRVAHPKVQGQAVGGEQGLAEGQGPQASMLVAAQVPGRGKAPRAGSLFGKALEV